MLPQRGLTALVLFFHWDSAPAPDAPSVRFNPPDPLSKGAIRACGLSIAAWLSLPASSGPASADALITLRSDFFAMLCCCPNPDAPRGLYVLHVFAAATWLAKSTFRLRRWIHVCRYGLSAHVRLFLSCHGGRSWVFAPVVGFTCAVPAFLPLSSFIDIDPKCGLNCVPNCGKSPLSSGSFAICRALCRCSARRIAR